MTKLVVAFAALLVLVNAATIARLLYVINS
jgi:hypothetical protein